MVDLSLILPVHNQEDIIEPVYTDAKHMLSKLGCSYEIILVENGSADATYAAVERLAEKYSHTRFLTAPKGYGSAVLAGLAKARGTYVSYMPSDGQIDLAVFPRLWKLVQRGKYELVKVKRVTRESYLRQVISSFFSLSVTSLFHIPPIDINGSPRIFLRKYLKVLSLSYTDSFIDAEFAVKAYILGWRIREIPMNTLPRAGGTSTRSWKTFAEFFRNLWEFKTSDKLTAWRACCHK